MAGYNGQSDYDMRLPELAKSMLNKFYNRAVALGARFSVPFASMIKFCKDDNSYMNQFSNTPCDVFDYFSSKGSAESLVVLYPGDEYQVGCPHNNSDALSKYNTCYHGLQICNFQKSPTVNFPTLEESFNVLQKKISDRYYRWLLAIFLKPIRIYIPDLNIVCLFDIVNGIFEKSADSKYDISVNSQPLDFACRFDWGFQTLGVSARHRVYSNYKNYRRHRILFSLNNAEIWLRLNLMLKWKNFKWLVQRSRGLIGQIRERYATQLE